MSNDADMHALYKEWDEASCAICMEHPHNAVLLLCSSHDKGCRSYICDTSYRHSNCLDRFRKLKDDNKENNTSPSLNPRNQHNTDSPTNGNMGLATSGNQTPSEGGHDVTIIDNVATVELRSGLGLNSNHVTDSRSRMLDEAIEVDTSSSLREMVNNGEYVMENLSESLSNLKCPLCRGSILGWKVVDEARRYLNLKSRNCSRESCSFSGNYRELRRHARRVHPAARPADIDPSRQRAWRRLENQREYDDIVSAIRSAMPGAVVLGDYVIENGGDRLSGERERGPSENGRWLSTFFLFQMIGSMEPVGGELRGGRSRALSRHPRSSGAFPRRRFLWGENLLGLQDNDDEEEEDEAEANVLSDIGEDISQNRRRRRRRLMHSRADEDQN